MNRSLAAVAVAVGLVLAVVAAADTPKISNVGPLGVRRGEAAEVTFFGSNLDQHPRLIAPFAAEIAGVGADAASWKVRITPAVETPVGVYVVRIRTDDGLSNPFLLAVGQVAQVAEKEDNGSFETAQVIPSPVVVEGQSPANDVDFFRFAGKKGERIVVDAQCARIGSGVDPTIRLTTASHKFVAAADDTPGLMTDARLSATLPEDGDYVIELSDSRYQGGARPVYRLLVGAVPVADEIYPLGGRSGETVGFELRGGTLPGPSVAAATLRPSVDSDPHLFRPRFTNHALGIAGPGQGVLDVESLPPLAVDDYPEFREPLDPSSPPIKAYAPAVFNGRIESRGDVDSFVVGVVPGQRLRIAVDAAGLGSALDGVLQVKGPDGAVLANADDTTVPAQGKAKAAKKAAINSPDPSLNFTVPAGMTEITLTLRDLSDHRGEGGPGYPYRLTVEPITNGFSLASTEDQVNIPRGGTAAVGVEVVRSGYDGPITLTCLNLPPGLAVRPGLINPGQTIGSLTITAAGDTPFDLGTLKLVGEGKGPGGPIVATASRSIVYAQQGGLSTNVVVQEGLPAATALPTPITLDSPATVVEVAHGTGSPVPIKATRAPGAEEAALTFGSLPLPSGLSVGSTLPAKVLEGNAIVNAAPEAPLGQQVIALTAKGNVAGKERTLAVPALTINVVRPASIELASPSIEIKGGETIEVKAKLVRHAGFKEPVTVKLDALPAGLKADPVTLAPDQAEVVLKVVADPKPAAAQANAQVALAIQFNKKDYATPTIPLAIKVIPAP